VSLLERINARHRAGTRPAKAFSEPPFWQTDSLRSLFSAIRPEAEQIENDFQGYINGAYKANGIVFAAIDRRQQVFSQARFAWREWRNGVPGFVFGSQELALLERPWPNGTTGELLALMEYDASLAGNAYWTTCDDAGNLGRSARGNRRLVRMRPDWVTIVINAPSGNPFGLDARVVAYSYDPRLAGNVANPEPTLLMPDEVCHFSPKPDPDARFRGMSWLTPVIRDVMADKAATHHKLKFFENGATPQFVVRFDKDSSNDEIASFVDRFKASHQGASNAYKTLFLAGGADITPLTVDLKQLDFKVTTGAGETRLAVAAGVPAVILGISEGLGGSSLNAGNFSAARRLFVDTTMRDAWAKVSASLQMLVTPPSPASELCVTDRDIPFLREDATDLANIRALNAQVLRTLGDGGWNPDAAIEYVRTDDLSRLLGNHTGLVPVQLQMPGDVGGSPTDGNVDGQ
jgi:phage portal protein BeeE